MLCQLTFTTSRARRISLRSVHSGLARAKLAYCPFVDCSNTATISSTTHGKILGLWNSAIRCFDVIKASNVDTLAEHEHHGWDDSPQHQCHVQPAGFLGIELRCILVFLLGGRLFNSGSSRGRIPLWVFRLSRCVLEWAMLPNTN